MTEFTGEIHPVADLFPMLPDDELAELADSIATDGLLQPLVLTPDGALLDGRNRLAACQRAEVEPRFEVYDGDPDVYALRANLNRRHLSQGQRAMILIAASQVNFPEIKPGAGGLDSYGLAGQHEISQSRIAFASMVQQHAPELVEQVIAGASLNEAYRIARERKTADEQEAERKADLPADLRERVDAGDLSVAEASAAAAVRQRRQAEAGRRDQLLVEVQAMADDFGPEPDLVDAPTMLTVVDGASDEEIIDAGQVAVELAGNGPSVADLEAQKAALTELARIKTDLRGFLRKHDPAGFDWGDMFLTGVRSALTQIVNEAHGVGHAYQHQQETRPKLRSVQ